MHDAGLAVFVTAFGFVIAAMLFSIRRTIEQRDETRNGHPVSPSLVNIAYSMFAGPFLVASRLMAIGTGQRVDFVLLSTGALITVLWSFCSGVLVVQLLALFGVVAL